MNVKSNIMDASTWSPPRRTIFVDGEKRVEKYPGMRHRHMVDPQGNMCRVPIVTAASIVVPDNYANQIMAVKLGQGWFPVDTCPLALMLSGQLMSESLDGTVRDGKPCEPGSYDIRKGCRHVHAEVAVRRGRHGVVEAERAERYKAQGEKDAEQRERHHQELLRAMTQGTKGKDKDAK